MSQSRRMLPFIVGDKTYHVRGREDDFAVIIEVHDYWWDDIGEETLRAAKTAIDIGAHVGVWSAYALHHCPQLAIVAIEPEENNWKLLVENLNRHDRMNLYQAAVWYQEKYPPSLVVSAYDTTGHHIMEIPVSSEDAYDHSRVPFFTVQEIMNMYQWDTIDILKIDCEGGEWNIMPNLPYDKIQTIVGEWHGAESRFDQELAPLMQKHGFNILKAPRFDETMGAIGLFLARK